MNESIRRTVGVALGAWALALPWGGAAQPIASAADSTAIREAASGYIHGWFDGDGDRMAAALHPELVKRLHVLNPRSGDHMVAGQGKSRLVSDTRAGGGSATDPSRRSTAIRILDIFRGAAVVRIDAPEWVDYLQLVREGERWLILNVLWEVRNEPEGSGR